MTHPLHEHATVITSAVGKGGAGKTSVAINLATILAADGLRVLFVNLDRQNNAAEDLGYYGHEGDDDGDALARALVDGEPLEVTLRDVRPGLDVVSCGRRMDDVVREFIREDLPLTALRDALTPVAERYDVIFIDCPPGGDLTTQPLALAAARWLLVPTRPDRSSRRGIEQLIPEITEAMQSNPDLDLLGVVLFAVGDRATRVERTSRDDVLRVLEGSGAPVFTTRIRSLESSAFTGREHGLTASEAAELWTSNRAEARQLDIRENVLGLAEDYRDLAIEVLTTIKERS